MASAEHFDKCGAAASWLDPPVIFGGTARLFRPRSSTAIGARHCETLD
jgi:hypothetical protein